jgi:serine/threonine-protein kinase RsbW
VEWCVDTRILGASAVLETEICAHLLRHCVEPGAVELARATIQQALRSRPPGMLWVGLDWEDPFPQLEVYRLRDGQMPTGLLAPGVARCHDQLALRTASLAGTEPQRTRLPVARAFEGDLDPHPRARGGIVDGLPLSVAGAMTDELAASRTLEEAAARAGATMAEQVAASTELPADSPAEIAELFIEAELQLGGDFHLVSTTETRAVLGNRRCPFGPSAHRGVCRFTSSLAGGLAARQAGAAEITLDERLAMGDAQCRLIVDLGTPTGRLTSHRYTWPPAGFVSVDTEEHPAVTRGFKVTLSLQLPRDRLSVPVTRHLVGAALREVGVITEDIDDVELALSEACANVIDHSGPGDIYEVAVTVAPTACHIRVIDLGHGFDHHALSPQMAALDAEHGRGVALMHALVDQVRFESQPEQGTVVHLVKNLRFDDNLPVRKLMLDSLNRQPD